MDIFREFSVILNFVLLYYFLRKRYVNKKQNIEDIIDGIFTFLLFCITCNSLLSYFSQTGYFISLEIIYLIYIFIRIYIIKRKN
jgi:peptidoglycan biosynthesis protein MviN/MurJ (putative lipid II flippase)